MKKSITMWAVYDTELKCLVNIYYQKKCAIEEIGGSTTVFKPVKVLITILTPLKK